MKNFFTSIKAYKYSISIALLIVVSLLNSCNLGTVRSIPTSNEYSAVKGDSVIINWHFENADRVYVDDIPGAFSPIDSVKIPVQGPQSIKVWAYKGNIDSLLEVKNISIKGNQSINDKIAGANEFSTIQRGPIKIYKEYAEMRGMESEYVRGITRDNNAVPASVKVTSIIDERNNKSLKSKIRFLVTDRYGNFIDNDLCKNKQMCELKYSCDEKKYTNLTYDNCLKEIAGKKKISNDITVLFDNSAASENNSTVISAVYKSAVEMLQNDKLQLVQFNHKSKEIIPLQYIESALSTLRDYQPEPPSGLNSLYKTVYETLRRSAASNSTNKVMIIITHYNDNSSLVYRVNDLIKISKEKNTPIYIIAVGDALQTYFLNYLCAKTGGRIYHLFNSEVSEITQIINEIYFAVNNYYEIEFSDIDFPFNDYTKSKPNTCLDLEGIFSIDILGNKFSSPVNIFAYSVPDYLQYQAVALFDEKSYIINQKYYDVLNDLAGALKDNPQYKIEIIGNSGNEGEDSYNNYLSVSRAESVKNYLFKMGVPTEQLVLKGIGYKKPLYFMAKYAWQESLNRRVEVRWLEPQKMPFEILAGIYANEAEAGANSDMWIKRGYRAYFERVIEYGQPRYQIKLWGYNSIDEAQNEIKKLQAKYKKDSFAIE